MTSLKEDLRAKYNPDGSDLRVLQLKLLDILVVVTDICDKYNIPYWLTGGTALGAVRHGGFIPWDDDIDIALLRKDYKKLVKILKKELPENMYLQMPSEKGYGLFFAKVRDRNSIVESEGDDGARYMEKGIFIDFFLQEPGYMCLKKVVDFFYGRSFRRLKRGRPFHSVQYFYEYVASLFIYPFGFLLANLARGLALITKPNNLIYSYGIDESIVRRADSILPVGQIQFEGKIFSSPRDMNHYLTIQFGDYMQIPPEEKRETHLTKVTYLM